MGINPTRTPYCTISLVSWNNSHRVLLFFPPIPSPPSFLYYAICCIHAPIFVLSYAQSVVSESEEKLIFGKNLYSIIWVTKNLYSCTSTT